MARGSEWRESTLSGSLALPLVIAGEVDVLPAEWGEVFEQLGVQDFAVPG
jgi:hypothetical protein